MKELVRWQDKDLSEYYSADDVDKCFEQFMTLFGNFKGEAKFPKRGK